MQIDMRSLAISEVRSDYTVSLFVEPAYAIYIENEFTITRSGSVLRVSPDGANADVVLGQVSPLIGVPISLVEILEDSGLLIVRFADGSQIEVPANDKYESWTVKGDDGSMVVCMPGGDLATWEPTAVNDD